ncbi:8642_t:CDS:2 [Entrophospora sp. SA101]|nr:8642_t:CDS:2 [Entrophospora sp. SA101]
MSATFGCNYMDPNTYRCGRGCEGDRLGEGVCSICAKCRQHCACHSK